MVEHIAASPSLRDLLQKAITQAPPKDQSQQQNEVTHQIAILKVPKVPQFEANLAQGKMLDVPIDRARKENDDYIAPVELAMKFQVARFNTLAERTEDPSVYRNSEAAAANYWEKYESRRQMFMMGALARYLNGDGLNPMERAHAMYGADICSAIIQQEAYGAGRSLNNPNGQQAAIQVSALMKAIPGLKA